MLFLDSRPPVQPSTLSSLDRNEPKKRKRTTNGVEFVPTTYEDPESGSVSSVVPGSLRVHGIVRAKGFLQFSDLRLKTDVQDLTDAVNIVTQLQGKSFKWRKGDNLEEDTGGERVIGLIAQEVRKVVPDVVHEDENGILSVAYAELVPILIEGLKEHLTQYESDKGELYLQLNSLNKKLENMQYLLNKAEQERGKNYKKIDL